ncbi:hypothetical protein UT300007_14620 [Clostridium sp. CTA-7]
MKGNLLSRIGWINNKKKKRGFTLLEITITISIQIILIGLSYRTVLVACNSYKTLKDKAIREDAFDDGLLTIDRLLKAKMIKDIEIKEGNLNQECEIVINIKENHNEDGLVQKKIKLDKFNQKIVLETYKNNYKRSTNVIMRDVSEFNIVKKKKLYYLKIKNSYGEEKIQCI